MEKNKGNVENVYTLDGKVPLLKAIPFGFQTVLISLASNIVPIIVIANLCGLAIEEKTLLIQSAILIAGIGTLIQVFSLWKIGARLPIVMGISFTFISVFAVIGSRFGYGAVVGATIAGGIIEGVLGLFAKYWMKYISPIVSANVVFAIGISLLPVVANSFGGGQNSENLGSIENWIVGFVTFTVNLIFYIRGKGYIKNLSIFFSLIVGYILALCMGLVDFSSLQGVSLVAVPSILPVKPEFHTAAIVSTAIIFLVSATETIGDTQAVAKVALHRDATPEEIRGSLACDGFISSLSGVFGGIPITSYSENIGIISMTGIINRYALGTGAVLYIICGFIPVIGGFFSSIPMAVLGGAIIMPIGSIVVEGMRMVVSCERNEKNSIITAVALGVGIGFTQVPQIFSHFPEIIQMIFSENLVAVVFVISLVLDRVIPEEKKA